MTLSIEICMWSRPARFRRSMRSGISRYPFVIMPAIMPWWRMRRMMSSSSGCSSGSPPEIVIIDVPSRAELVDAALHLGQRDGIAGLVVLIAVSAVQVATPHRNNVRHHGVRRIGQRVRNHREFARPPRRRLEPASCRISNALHHFYFPIPLTIRSNVRSPRI